MIQATCGGAASQSSPNKQRKTFAAASLIVALLLSFTGSAPAAINEYWAGSGDTNNPTSGTWTNGVGTGTNWSDGTFAIGTATWTNGNTAFFGGADGSYGIKVGGAVTTATMRFLASGYTLTNNTAQTISGTGSSESLIVDSGKTATVGTNVTFSFAPSSTATVKVNVGGTPGGTLIVENGGIVQQTVNGNVTILGSNTVVSVKTGGIFRDAYTGSGSPHLIVGNADGDDATLSVDGGTVTIGRTTASFWFPGQPIGQPTVNYLKGTLTMNGGTLKNPTAGAQSSIVLGQTNNYIGIFNLNGGTVTIQSVQSSGSTGVAGTGTSIMNFNGGTLKALIVSLNSASNFVNNLTAAYVRNGGAVIDNSGTNIIIGQALLHTTNTLDNLTDGGLTSLSGGSLTLTGTNTYNGPTLASAGTLVTTTASTGGGSYTVADGATLEVRVNTAGTSLTNSSLTLGTVGNLTNTFTLNGNASTTIPAVVVGGTLTLNGSVKVNVNGTLSGPSPTLLMSYGSISGSGSFSIGTISPPLGYSVVLTNDTANKQLKLIYTALPTLAVQWATNSGNWDTTTTNWVPLGGGSPTNYYELSPVTFDDTALFAATRTVTLTSIHSPANITVNTTNNYVFAGTNIIGSGMLTKSGSGALVLGVNSTQSGATVINSGTVQVGNGGTVGSLGSGNVTNNGALAFNRTDALTNASTISGSGSLTNSSGTLTLSAANSYSGATVVNAGKLVTSTASKGGGSYTVADGATLEVQVNNSGTSLTNSSLKLGTSGNLTNNFTLNGNASITIPAVKVNGALNLNGTVTVNVTGSFSGPSTNLLISYGSTSGSGHFTLGNAPSVVGYSPVLMNDTTSKQLKLLYLLPGSSLQWATNSGNWDTTTANWAPLGGGSMTTYSELASVTFDDTAPFAATRTVTLTGDHTPTDMAVNTANQYVFTGGFSILGSGTLTMDGGGTLVLGVNNTQSGGTTINSGTVQVGTGGTAGSIGSGAIADNGALVFNRSDNISLASVISGSGSLTSSGSGTVTLLATNSYSGATVVNAGKLSVLAANSGGGDCQVADGAILEVKSTGTNSYLQMNSLTLGTSGNLTNNFILETGRGAIFPLVYPAGNLILNGTVTVNVSSSTPLAAGTYLLMQYGSISGSGSFVAGGLPGIGTLTNDTSANQLKLIITTPGLFWDAGNTTNGSVIDAASGTWDLTANNLVWNNGGVNVAFANGNSAIFGGADGAYGIKVGAAINPPTITFSSSGYTLTNDTPQTITLSGVSTGIPKLVVAAGKTNTIGNNVTVLCPNTTYFGNTGDTPGGTLIIGNGGVFQETTANTFAMDGAGTVVSVQTGGVFEHNSGTSGQLAIGVSNVFNPTTLSVDGGSVLITGNSCQFNIPNGPGSAGGILTLNSGTVSMPAGTTQPLTLGVQSGNAGIINLNGGVLNVAEIVKGNASAFATNNFNGGTLKAVNATFASTFMNGLDRVNVRNGGAVIDDGGFAITIGQQLQHSTIAGDNATDGGLTKLGAGTLILTNANTYTGTTTVSNGTLLVNGSILTNAMAATGGRLGGTGTISGTVTVAAGGTLSPGVGDTGALTITGNLNLQGNLAVVVNKSVSPSNNLSVVSGTLTNTGTGTVTVANLGSALSLGDSFKLFSQPVVGGSALTITPAPGVGFSWQNKLAVDGSIVVVSAVASYPTNITVAVSGNTLTLTWPATHLGWIAQSNSVGLASTSSWFDISGSDSVTGLTNTINPSVTNVFYRLRHP
jgi:autotransporter-associated beta strand protein